MFAKIIIKQKIKKQIYANKMINKVQIKYLFKLVHNNAYKFIENKCRTIKLKINIIIYLKPNKNENINSEIQLFIKCYRTLKLNIKIKNPLNLSKSLNKVK